MTWRFSPPISGYGPSYRADADRVTQALWGHFRGAPEPTSVLKTADTYTDQSYVYSDDIDSADRFYQGGHLYDVDDDEAFALQLAGYTVVPDLMAELQATLNILAGTTGLEAQAAANAWAGTSGLELLGALNSKAGTSGLGLNAVCNLLAGTTGMEAPAALAALAGTSSLFSRFAVLYQAVSLDSGSFTDGDDWPNEGTAGSSYDAQAQRTDVGHAFPHLVTVPSPGFEINNTDVNYYDIADAAAIKPGTSSFLLFGWIYRAGVAADSGNILAKITGTPTVDFAGFQIASGPTWGNQSVALIGDGGTDYAAAIVAGNLAAGEHLLVMQVDRDADELTLYVDGVASTPVDASGFSDLTNTHELIFGRGQEQTLRAFGLAVGEVFTETEITEDLPALLGFS